ncbi:zinc finger protein 619-like [Polypterus senegalus]
MERRTKAASSRGAIAFTDILENKFAIYRKEMEHHGNEVCQRGGKFKDYYMLVNEALKAAVEVVRLEFTDHADRRFADLHLELAARDNEIKSLRMQLQISQNELRAARDHVNRTESIFGTSRVGNRQARLDCNGGITEREAASGSWCRPTDRAWKSTRSSSQRSKDKPEVFKTEQGLQIKIIQIKEEAAGEDFSLLTQHTHELGLHEDKKSSVSQRHCHTVEKNVVLQDSLCAEDGLEWKPVLIKQETNDHESNLFVEDEMMCVSENMCLDVEGASALRLFPERLCDIQCWTDERLSVVSVDTKEREQLASSDCEPGIEVHRSSALSTVCQPGWKTSQKDGTTLAPYCYGEYGKTFTSSSNIKRQQKQTHAENIPYIETSSNSRSSNKKKMNNTVQIGSLLTWNIDVQQQQKIQPAEKPHCCTVCGKRFTRKMNLQQHQAIHTGEKPYSCTECGNRYARKTSLQQHQRVHTGEKPFCCTHCGKRFIWKSSFLEHRKFHADKSVSALKSTV